MWLPTVPTSAQPESSAAPSTARRSRATSLRSPRSCARVARAGVEPRGASAAVAAFVAALLVVFFADAVALAVGWSVALLVALAVARRRVVVHRCRVGFDRAHAGIGGRVGVRRVRLRAAAGRRGAGTGDRAWLPWRGLRR